MQKFSMSSHGKHPEGFCATNAINWSALWATVGVLSENAFIGTSVLNNVYWSAPCNFHNSSTAALHQELFWCALFSGAALFQNHNHNSFSLIYKKKNQQFFNDAPIRKPHLPLSGTTAVDGWDTAFPYSHSPLLRVNSLSLWIFSFLFWHKEDFSFENYQKESCRPCTKMLQHCFSLRWRCVPRFWNAGKSVLSKRYTLLWSVFCNPSVCVVSIDASDTRQWGIFWVSSMEISLICPPGKERRVVWNYHNPKQWEWPVSFTERSSKREQLLLVLFQTENMRVIQDSFNFHQQSVSWNCCCSGATRNTSQDSQIHWQWFISQGNILAQNCCRKKAVTTFDFVLYASQVTHSPFNDCLWQSTNAKRTKTEFPYCSLHKHSRVIRPQANGQQFLLEIRKSSFCLA